MRIKIKSLLLIVLFGVVMFKTNTLATEDVKQLVDDALSNKTFYHFNLAYDKVTRMPETSEKYEYLEKLTSIHSIVWTEEISKALEMLVDLTKSSSANTYDEIEAYVTNSKLGEWDRGYLLGELTSWGRKLVWTDDYRLAVNGLLNAGSNINEESLANAEKLIKNVKNEINKEYLLEQIRPVRKKFDDSSNLDTLNEILKLRNDASISRDQKVAKIIQIANSKSGIEIPKEYLSGIGIYIITDYLMQCEAPNSLWDIQHQIDTVISKQEVLNPIINPIKDPVAALKKLKESPALTIEEAIIGITSIVKSNTGLEIPEGYYNNAGMYNIANALLRINIEEGTTVSDIQRIINREIAFSEASKLKFHFANVRGHIFENNTNHDLNITEKLMETVGEGLLPDTKIEFNRAGWQRGGPDVPFEPSEYIYIKDGQVYLRSKAIPKGGYVDNIKIEVSHKGVIGTGTGLWVDIRPASSVKSKDTVGAITRHDGGYYKIDRNKLPESVRSFTEVGIIGRKEHITREIAMATINKDRYRTAYKEDIGVGGSRYEYTLIVLYDNKGKALAYYALDGYEISDIELVE